MPSLAKIVPACQCNRNCKAIISKREPHYHRSEQWAVKRLDSKSSKRRRPDFLISTSSVRPKMLCEVKTVDSAFYPRDKKKYGVENIHISTHDEKFCGTFKNVPIDLMKIDKGLSDAIDKRKALVEDDSSFADLPLLVAFFFDFYADYLVCYPRSFDERDESFREVSGILTIASQVESDERWETLSHEEQRRRAKAEFEGNAARPTRFVLVQNQATICPVPEDFARL